MELLRYNASLNFAPAELGGVFPAHALSCIGRPVALLHIRLYRGLSQGCSSV